MLTVIPGILNMVALFALVIAAIAIPLFFIIGFSSDIVNAMRRRAARQ